MRSFWPVPHEAVREDPSRGRHHGKGSEAGHTDERERVPAALTDEARAALGKELEPHFSGRGTIRFPANDSLPDALVRRLVELRLEETAAHRRR